LLRKALEWHGKHKSLPSGGGAHDAVWKALMLSPYDYAEDERAIFNPLTRSLMKKIAFEHGGPEYDRRYPDGIPTSIVITAANGSRHDTGLIMYPAGHARNTTANLKDILAHKFKLLGDLALAQPQPIIDRFNSLAKLSAADLQNLYDFELLNRGDFA